MSFDLTTYEPRGDKKNSEFFHQYLPMIYERRQSSGVADQVGADQMYGRSSVLSRSAVDATAVTSSPSPESPVADRPDRPAPAPKLRRRRSFFEPATERPTNGPAVEPSGGPESVHADASPRVPGCVFDLDVPVLGICYGMQAMAEQFGGKVEGSDISEFGYAQIRLVGNGGLLHDIRDHIDDHARYIGGWIKALRREKRLILKAAAEAQRTVDWMFEAVGGDSDAVKTAEAA